MTQEQRSRRNARLLVAAALLVSIAAGAALTEDLQGVPKASAAAEPRATTRTSPVQGAQGSLIDHSVVEQLEPQPEADTGGVSIAAYGS